MEMELKGIIEKIKTEGVTEAEKQATQIVTEAEDKAKKTIQDAETQKDAIISGAQDEAKKLKSSSEEAMRQASRNVLLGLRESIIALFDKVIKKEVADNLSAQVMKEMILRLVEKFNESGETDIEVLLSKEEKQQLEGVLLKALKSEVAKGVTLKASSSLEHGFRIGIKDSNAYYDFTDEAIEEAFKIYLNKRLVEILTPGKKDAK